MSNNSSMNNKDWYKNVPEFSNDVSEELNLSEIKFSKTNRMSSVFTEGLKGIGSINEPAIETIKRDARNIWRKLSILFSPYSDKNSKRLLRDWDLWGPLIWSMILSITLSILAPHREKTVIFTMIHLLIWGGSAVITINMWLFDINISFFQSICSIGYCIFPISIVSFISLFIGYTIIHFLLVFLALSWSIYTCQAFYRDIIDDDKYYLTIYPIFALYLIISWIVLEV